MMYGIIILLYEIKLKINYHNQVVRFIQSETIFEMSETKESSDKQPKKKTFEVLSIHPVVYWNYKSSSCSICRSDILDKCIECESNKKESVKCIRVKGECGHIYHEHCINRWLQTQNYCPVDTVIWNVVERDV
jgi:E3 ubiquitin-protein ligase RBX1